jgi:hypothetical protein
MCTGAAIVAIAVTPCRAGVITISLYIGASQTRPSDLHVTQPSLQNDATMHKVPWPGYPFRFEPYYGVRVSYAASRQSQTSIALDFTHYKIYARTEDIVAQDGTWHGGTIADHVAMSQRVQSIEMTHGLNMLGVSLMQRLSVSQNGVYIGAGPVIYEPHTESRVDGHPFSGYRFGGWGFQTHAGVRTCAGDQPLFAEIKYSQGHPVVPIAQGEATTTLQTVHELIGLDFNHCRN